ncbi:CopG family transcriptional regulator [Halobacteriales archaeon QH_8_68_33]|nr:MAG: CopG family transcriptional regulator [Halobacteriales archaeon QH_8_68_33]
MSNTDTTGDGPEKTNINIRVTETFLEDIDDAVRHPDLTRESWKEIAAVEHARRTGESETFSREEILDDDE